MTVVDSETEAEAEAEAEMETEAEAHPAPSCGLCRDESGSADVGENPSRSIARV
jgi:hypothetical protein